MSNTLRRSMWITKYLYKEYAVYVTGSVIFCAVVIRVIRYSWVLQFTISVSVSADMRLFSGIHIHIPITAHKKYTSENPAYPTGMHIC
jgi:hypothetical protein